MQSPPQGWTLVFAGPPASGQGTGSRGSASARDEQHGQRHSERLPAAPPPVSPAPRSRVTRRGGACGWRRGRCHGMRVHLGESRAPGEAGAREAATGTTLGPPGRCTWLHRRGGDDEPRTGRRREPCGGRGPAGTRGDSPGKGLPRPPTVVLNRLRGDVAPPWGEGARVDCIEARAPQRGAGPHGRRWLRSGAGGHLRSHVYRGDVKNFRLESQGRGARPPLPRVC